MDEILNALHFFPLLRRLIPSLGVSASIATHTWDRELTKNCQRHTEQSVVNPPTSFSLCQSAPDSRTHNILSTAILKYAESIGLHASVAALATMPAGEISRTLFADTISHSNEGRPQQWNRAEMVPVG